VQFVCEGTWRGCEPLHSGQFTAMIGPSAAGSRFGEAAPTARIGMPREALNVAARYFSGAIAFWLE
jgi:hypothetical protein